MLATVARARSSTGTSNGKDRLSRKDRGVPSMVIAIFARAKLFGIKILTIDARVAIAPDAARDMTSVAARTVISQDPYRLEQHVGQRADLARAVRLLEKGTKSLDEARACTAWTAD